MIRSLVIGTRTSRLALVQANQVAETIRRVSPDTDIRIKTINTTGDRDKDTPLDKMASTGVFVKELERALFNNQVDLAVHSLKDMPSDQSEGLVVSAVLQRANASDALVSCGATLAELPLNARVGTGSLRRRAQLMQARPDIEVLPLRGNIETRLKKLDEGRYQAIITAAAALERLNIKNRITQLLPVERFIPAGCQGVIGIEIHKHNQHLHDFIQKFNHLPTWYEIQAERAFLHKLGAGCHAPVGVKAEYNSGRLVLNAMVAANSGNPVIYHSVHGRADQAEQLGKSLAELFISKGAPDFAGK